MANDRTDDELKLQFTLRAKAEMRAYLRSLTWEQKVASIERMNEFSRKARESMRKVREGSDEPAGSVS